MDLLPTIAGGDESIGAAHIGRDGGNASRDRTVRNRSSSSGGAM
jgi:hypothetical protein